MTAHTLSTAAACIPAARRPLRTRGLMELFGLWRQRRCLASLDDHLLRDIGLTRDAALREARRPLWDAPQSWRR